MLLSKRLASQVGGQPLLGESCGLLEGTFPSQLSGGGGQGHQGTSGPMFFPQVCGLKLIFLNQNKACLNDQKLKIKPALGDFSFCPVS